MTETKDTLKKNQALREKDVLFGFIIQREKFDGSIQISVRWGRITTVLLVLLVAGWIGAAGALYTYLKYSKDFEIINFTDTLLFRRDELRRQAGDHHIKKSIAEIEAGNYWDAFRLLHLGVARSPDNLQGRRLLAEFYELGRNRPNTAVDYMLEGLDRGGIEDPDYLKYLLRLLLRHQMDATVQELADKYLPEEPVGTEVNRLIALGAANANYLRGNYDRADDYLIAYNLIDSLEGLQLSSRISWDRGNKIAAITKLEQSLNRFPNSESLLMQLSHYYREIGEIDKARRYAILRNVKDPLSAAPRLELLYIYNQSGDVEREQQEIQRMFEQFSDNKDALLKFANFAAKTGNIELARRIYEQALENEFDVDMFAILLIESQIVAKDYEGCLSFSEELIKEQPDWLTRQWGLFNGLRAVASYGINRPDLGEIYLQHFIDEASHKPQIYLNIANHFSDIGRNQQTRKILAIAYRQTPANQKILTRLIKIDLKLGKTENLNDLLTRLLQMRRPQEQLLVEAYHKLGSDRFIFTKNRETLLLQIGAILSENTQSLSSVDM